MDTTNFARSRHANFVTTTGGLAVYPLWMGGVQDALDGFDKVRPNLPMQIGVAAMLSGHSLDLREMDALEDAGLLVLQVPPRMQTRVDELAAFVEAQIAGIRALTASANVQPVRQAGTSGELDDGQLTEDDEQALLESINDPDSDEGSV